MIAVCTRFGTLRVVNCIFALRTRSSTLRAYAHDIRCVYAEQHSACCNTTFAVRVRFGTLRVVTGG